MGWWLIFAVFLYFACAALIIAEVFVPSGGLISICALACLVGGIVIFFQYSVTAGWIGIGIAAIMIPSVLVVAYKIFPKTRFGKSVTLTPPERKQGDAIPDTDRLTELLSAVGVVLTPLRPVGMCDFSGRRVECVAESGYVDKGKKVKVINVESTQLTVRIIEES
ncbi:MAG TPA: NfeD family protein [Sedimentisphaerales bacterium]|nr:NfeD family protein [Sedimentisphaerales bacterium]